MMMKYEDAIVEMEKASEAFKRAIELLRVAVSEKMLEKEPPYPERKIDDPRLQGWYIGDNGRVYDSDGLTVNPFNESGRTTICANLIVSSSATMRDVIYMLNKYDKYVRNDPRSDAPEGLCAAIDKLVRRVHAAGFGCDLYWNGEKQAEQ